MALRPLCLLPTPLCSPALCPLPLRAQVCQLDCREATDLNVTQAGWINPPYAVSSSLSRQPLGYKVRLQYSWYS